MLQRLIIDSRAPFQIASKVRMTVLRLCSLAVLQQEPFLVMLRKTTVPFNNT